MRSRVISCATEAGGSAFLSAAAIEIVDLERKAAANNEPRNTATTLRFNISNPPRVFVGPIAALTQQPTSLARLCVNGKSLEHRLSSPAAPFFSSPHSRRGSGGHRHSTAAREIRLVNPPTASSN